MGPGLTGIPRGCTPKGEARSQGEMRLVRSAPVPLTE